MSLLAYDVIAFWARVPLNEFSSLTAVPGPSLTPIVGCLSEPVDVHADKPSDVRVSVRTTRQLSTAFRSLF